MLKLWPYSPLEPPGWSKEISRNAGCLNNFDNGLISNLVPIHYLKRLYNTLSNPEMIKWVF